MLKIDLALCDDLSLELMGYLIPVTVQALVNRISTYSYKITGTGTGLCEDELDRLDGVGSCGT